ncbi:MAG: MBL fold metallo-hydrolase [Bacteroidaceae bacterium]|nr:MBL fold metallo-hydrolase [Bacteroidaceae bacterium]
MNVKCFEFNFLPVNTYVVWDETLEAAVIDPGCFYDGESDALKDFISSNSLKVRHLLNTHLHFDHVLGNTFVEETYGIRAQANDADDPWIRFMARKMAAFGIRYEGHVSPIAPENVLKEGDTVTFGGTMLNVMQVPGHSPGSIVFYNRREDTVFTGDVLFQGSIGRADFADSDPQALIRGIREKLLVLPDRTVVYPGHGPATTIGSEKPYFI